MPPADASRGTARLFGWAQFMRNVLAKMTRPNAEMVAAAIRTIFAQPDAGAVAAQFERIVATRDAEFPYGGGKLIVAQNALDGSSACG